MKMQKPWPDQRILKKGQDFDRTWVTLKYLFGNLMNRV